MSNKGVLKPSYTQRPAFFAGILGMLAALAGTLLVMGYLGTKDAIALRAQEDLERSLAQVLPSGYDNQPALDWVELPQDANSPPLRLYLAREAGRVTGMAFSLSENGYSGPIRVLMGMDVTGRLSGVRVLAHTETPGLGDKIELSKDDWVLDFDGLSFAELAPEDWAVKKDGGHFDQFAGATITPRAVVKAVKRGLELQEARLNGPQIASLAAQQEVAAAQDSRTEETKP